MDEELRIRRDMILSFASKGQLTDDVVKAVLGDKYLWDADKQEVVEVYEDSN